MDTPKETMRRTKPKNYKEIVIDRVNSDMFRDETHYLADEVDKLMAKYTKKYHLPMGAVACIIVIPKP